MKRLLVAVATLAAVASARRWRRDDLSLRQRVLRRAPARDATTLVVADAVTPEQRAEARDVARREKTLAAEMTRDRREQEALAKPAHAGSLSAPRAGRRAAGHRSEEAREEARQEGRDRRRRDFVAAVPKTKKAGS